jgi:hypothetical protein
MLVKESRKRNKVFTKMAKSIRSRNSDQCRSHHQKLMQYHGDINNIILHYQSFVFKKMESLLKDASTI